MLVGLVSVATRTLSAMENLTTVEGWYINWAVIFIQDGLQSTSEGDFSDFNIACRPQKVIGNDLTVNFHRSKDPDLHYQNRHFYISDY